VGFRIYRRKSLGGGFWAGASKTGLGVGRRGRPLSVSVGRRGPRASLRLLPGISYIFTRRKR
jgi:hypothetical protein